MKIKLHNSLCKTDRDMHFLFDEKICIAYTRLYYKKLGLTYKIDDCYLFLCFNTKTKEWTEEYGFGLEDKDPFWWKNSCWNWKEMSKEDEN